jgi:GNAT superfamily N-acetyltransferase
MSGRDPKNAISVRPARRTDAAEMADLAGQLGYPSTAAQVERRLERILADKDHAVYIAARPDERVVGWIHVFGYATVEDEPRAEVGGLVVDQGHRGTSVGRRLTEQAERWAREQGYGVIALRSNVIRTEAHAFYERLGYVSPKTQKTFRKIL